MKDYEKQRIQVQKDFIKLDREYKSARPAVEEVLRTL